ncbi:MAG TPA: FtsQ-type POTRA domain-containing protein [Mycobacteriales bacterium]
MSVRASGTGTTRVAARPAPPAPDERSHARVWLAAGTAVLLLGVAVWAVGFTGLLGVRTVAVTGTGALTADDIRAAAGVRPGEPLARVDTGAVATRVRSLPGVSRVAVTRSWPSTLRITLTERTGIAVLPRDGATWLIDSDGVVFQRLTVRPAGLPRLAVAAAGRGDPATTAALGALTALPPALARQVLVVTARTPDSVTLTLTGGRTVVWGGDEDRAAKARVLPALLTRPGSVYDVSTPAVVTVR